MIEFKGVTKIYPANSLGSEPNVVLNNVSFKIDQQEFVSIVGKSGAGKTTLLKLLLTEESPSQGEILFDGENIHQIEDQDVPDYRRKIGAIFQEYRLLPGKTVYENVSYVLEVMGVSPEEIEEDVPRVLEIVGLTEKANSFPAELSGGEKQRVAIARAFIHRPEVILADEPTGNLDPYHTLEIVSLLSKINTLGTTVILATHDRDIVNSLGRRVITLQKGELVKDEQEGRFIL